MFEIQPYPQLARLVESVHFFKKDYTATLTTYHFRLERDLVAQLDQHAKYFSVTRSALLRNLIKTQLLKSGPRLWITDTYLMEKTYPQIAQLISGHAGEASLEMLLMEGRANIELGPVNIPHVQSLLRKINIMGQRQQGNYKILAEQQLLEGECWVLQGNMERALQHLNEAKAIAYANADYIFLSDVHYFLGLTQHADYSCMEQPASSARRAMKRLENWPKPEALN